MGKKTWLTFTFLAIAVAGYAIVQYVIMDGTQAGLVQMKLQFIAQLNTLWYIMLYTHIIGSVVALVIGPFTLSSKFRERKVKRHRILGKLYMLGILLGGASGLYLAFYATGGLVGKLGFGTLSILWILFVYQAFHTIKRNDVVNHQKWMIRNYSLTFAAVTLRIWLPLFTVLFGLERFEFVYALTAWFAWVPNLLIAEFYIQRKLSKNAEPQPIDVS